MSWDCARHISLPTVTFAPPPAPYLPRHECQPANSTLGTRYHPILLRRSWPSSRPSRGGNRQIRTTPTPLARGGTPVIAWSGGGLLGRVQRRDVPDLHRVVKATAHSACTPAPLVAAPLAPDGPTLRLRSPDLPPPPAAYLMELRSTRKPRRSYRPSGESPLPRPAERQYPALPYQPPPRRTRYKSDVAPVGSVAEPLG